MGAPVSFLWMADATSNWDFLVPFESWKEPRTLGGPFRLLCWLERSKDVAEAARTFKDLPSDLASFWSIYRGGHLFQDIDYGQWGLHLFSPSEAEFETKRQTELGRGLEKGDIVIAEFRGDLDLMIVDKTGHTFVGMPLDPRGAWPRWNSFHQFMRSYVDNDGNKHWESVRT